MRFGRFIRAVVVTVVGVVHQAAAWPPGFEVVPVSSGWTQPVGMTFVPAHMPGGATRMLVWEKAGRVWIVEDGVRLPQPLLDIAPEVGNWRDHGLLGLAVDPNFEKNGYLYVLYVVDYHHLTTFGTPAYNPSTDVYFRDTIGRLTRYTCDASTDFTTVVPGSRTVLIGETISTGFPVCHQSHGIGTLIFGEDGTLLASCGDGASYESVDVGGPTSGSSNTALADGIIRAAEDVGAYRAQLVDTLSGKVIRIDPATGNGVPSNPFYDAANPRAPRSRVWAMGFRNPFRMSLRPGTGNVDPAAGDPGTLYIGDVGWYSWEELNVADRGGLNFGWPAFEGYLTFPAYYFANVPNQDAPNPLYAPGAGCEQEFFYFRQLLTQDTLNPNPSFPNPCNPQVQIGGSARRFVHRRPSIDWSHGGVSRCGGYSGQSAVVYNLGAPDSPVSGPQFGGASSTGGVWCGGPSYPEEYRNTYFHADFATRWMRQMRFDVNDQPIEVRDFENSAGPVVAMAAHPVTGDLYFIAYNDVGNGSVNRLRNVVNSAPVVMASATPGYGPTPLAVQFSSEGTSDPDGDDLTYRWDFGDGSAPSSEANPVHVYEDIVDITAEGSFVARIFAMDPPRPTGGGNHDPEVMRDGVYPAVGSTNSSLQYDTYHGGEQSSTDWIGYQYSAPREFRSMIFQEGIHFVDGGWFQSLRVHYLMENGQWRAVTGLQVSPLYPGNNRINFETYVLRFDPVVGTAIRIEGVPAGSARFISVGELRVFALGDGSPSRREATLTVTDGRGGSTEARLGVSLNNTPPVVRITSPIDGATYSVCDHTTVPLTAEISDAEHGPDELTCVWHTILHHDEHTHPEPPDENCQTSTVLSPHGSGEDIFYFEIVLTVTDADGLSTSVSTIVHAVCCPPDWNRDGTLASQDFFDFLGDFFGNNADFNGDGGTTSQDFFDYVVAFMAGC